MSGPVVAEPLARERALGALTGLALGDALGMPTQSMSPARIRRCYGEITGLRDAVAEQPIAPSVPAGSVTDDTEQALILAGLLIDGGGRIDPHQLADALLRWEDDMRARGSLDLLGPSTKLALERVRAGADPHCTGRQGTTNGAAMRVAPVGVAFSLSADGDALARAVQASCLVTHDTRQGFEAAGLLAAAVSVAIDGVDAVGALEAALDFVAAHPEAGPVAPAKGQRLWLRLRIGPAGESASEPFDVCVCEPAWLSRQIREHGPLVDGADHLFVRDLNLRDVTAFLSHYIAGKVGHWSHVTERLARVFEPATAPTA